MCLMSNRRQRTDLAQFISAIAHLVCAAPAGVCVQGDDEGDSCSGCKLEVNQQLLPLPRRLDL